MKTWEGRELSERKYLASQSWARAVYVMQRVVAERMAGTERIERILGAGDMLDTEHGGIWIPMICVRAMALEQLLKSLVIRGGERGSVRGHDLRELFDRVTDEMEGWKGLRTLCEREYKVWLRLAQGEAKRGGSDIKLDTGSSLRELLTRHRDDFAWFRYAEEKGNERKTKDWVELFAALCALEAVRFQKTLEDEGYKEKYMLSGSTGPVRNVLVERAKRLLAMYMADGGQDMRIKEQ